MITKLIEIRDAGTRIGAIAIKLKGDDRAERQFLFSLGFGTRLFGEAAGEKVLLIRPDDELAYYEPARWLEHGMNTTCAAHRYIEEHFDAIPTCGVIDLEYINGETDAPKTSEIWR